jgi:hypothetical protein
VLKLDDLKQAVIKIDRHSILEVRGGDLCHGALCVRSTERGSSVPMSDDHSRHR